jgi:hypothetical protein
LLGRAYQPQLGLTVAVGEGRCSVGDRVNFNLTRTSLHLRQRLQRGASC